MRTDEVHSIITKRGARRRVNLSEWINRQKSGKTMAYQNRNVAVLFSLIASMTIGALVLMALDHNGPSAAAYSLSSYLRLDPVDDVVKNSVQAKVRDWGQIEVVYSDTVGGNVEEMALLTGLANGDRAEYHFIVCNGNGADDGQVQAGKRWENQLTDGRAGVIRVLVISNERIEAVTDCQIQRTNALVESLSRTFDINPRQIRYPVDWQM